MRTILIGVNYETLPDELPTRTKEFIQKVINEERIPIVNKLRVVSVLEKGPAGNDMLIGVIVTRTVQPSAVLSVSPARLRRLMARIVPALERRGIEPKYVKVFDCDVVTLRDAQGGREE